MPIQKPKLSLREMMLAKKEGHGLATCDTQEAGKVKDGPTPSPHSVQFPSLMHSVEQEVKKDLIDMGLMPLQSEKFAGKHLPTPRRMDQCEAGEVYPAGTAENIHGDPWEVARTSFETDLVIWLEPPPNCHAWIAIRRETGDHLPPPLILLHRLPLANRRDPNRQDPF
jgi:hypothetical protein